MIKIITIVLCLGALYWIIFVRNKKNNDNGEIYDSVACSTCNTYISKKEAISSSGKYYCSKECLN